MAISLAGGPCGGRSHAQGAVPQPWQSPRGSGALGGRPCALSAKYVSYLINGHAVVKPQGALDRPGTLSDLWGPVRDAEWALGGTRAPWDADWALGRWVKRCMGCGTSLGGSNGLWHYSQRHFLKHVHVACPLPRRGALPGPRVWDVLGHTPLDNVEAACVVRTGDVAV